MFFGGFTRVCINVCMYICMYALFTGLLLLRLWCRCVQLFHAHSVLTWMVIDGTFVLYIIPCYSIKWSLLLSPDSLHPSGLLNFVQLGILPGALLSKLLKYLQLTSSPKDSQPPPRPCRYSTSNLLPSAA